MLLPAVLANGGSIAPAGGHAFALAARAAGVPLIVLSPVYKLCPRLPQDLEKDTFALMSNPARVIGFEQRTYLLPLPVVCVRWMCGLWVCEFVCCF